jgi:hypothetical protein
MSAELRLAMMSLMMSSDAPFFSACLRSGELIALGHGHFLYCGFSVAPGNKTPSRRVSLARSRIPTGM